MMAAEVEVEPADCDWQSGVCTHSDETQGAVFEMVVVVGG